MAAKLHKEVRELVEKVEAIGWTFTGKYDGGDHPIMVHTSGKKHSIPGTPSDVRSMPNTLATLERIGGQRLDRSGKRRKSHKKVEGSGFSIEDAKREQAEFHRTNALLPIADLWEQRRELIERLIFLVNADGDRTDEASSCLWKIRATERGLKGLGQSVRDFDLMDLPVDGKIKEAAKTRLNTPPKPDPTLAKYTEAARASCKKARAKTDDFDGKLLLPSTEPWRVELLGKTYDLMLSPDNRAMVLEFLTQLTDGAKVVTPAMLKKEEAARKAAASKLAGKAIRDTDRDGKGIVTPDGTDAKTIRKWLRDNGYQVGDRGRFSAEHMHAWNTRNKRARREYERTLAHTA